MLVPFNAHINNWYSTIIIYVTLQFTIHIELRVNRILKAYYFIFYRNSNISNTLTSQVIRLLELDYAVDFDMNDMYIC